MNPSLLLRDAIDLVNKQQGQESSGHDYYHVQRVVTMAKRLAQSVDGPVDDFVLELACWLHDVDDRKIVYEGAHVTVASFLAAHDVSFELAVRIRDIIDNLSYTATKAGKVETTIEGQIAQDADRLDALGAIGIARTFAYGGAKGRLIITPEAKDRQDTVAHFDDKLLKLESLMNTEEGRRIAHERTAFMKDFLAHLYQETGH